MKTFRIVTLCVCLGLMVSLTGCSKTEDYSVTIHMKVNGTATGSSTITYYDETGTMLSEQLMGMAWTDKNFKVSSNYHLMVKIEGELSSGDIDFRVTALKSDGNGYTDDFTYNTAGGSFYHKAETILE